MDSLLGSFDCEDMRDFAQYYRGRYFGLLTEGGTIAPATLDRQTRQADHVSLSVYDPAGSRILPVDLTRRQLEERGRFGLPILGNVPIGPTFAYVFTAPKRESAKGLSLPNCTFKFPEHGGLSDKLRNVMDLFWHPESRQQQALRGEVFGQAEDREIAYAIYNRSYPTGLEAVQQLEQGDRLGVPVSHRLGLYLAGGKESIQLRFGTSVIGDVVPVGRGYRTTLKEESAYLQPLVSKILGEAFNE